MPKTKIETSTGAGMCPRWCTSDHHGGPDRPAVSTHMTTVGTIYASIDRADARVVVQIIQARTLGPAPQVMVTEVYAPTPATVLLGRDDALALAQINRALADVEKSVRHARLADLLQRAVQIIRGER